METDDDDGIPCDSSSSPTPDNVDTGNAPRSSSLTPLEQWEGGDRMVTLGKGVSMDAKDFVDCFRVLAQENEKAEELRRHAWHHCDSNGNGIISLAECDLWIKEVLKSKCQQGEEGERIWKRYRRCYIHAFNRAKNVSKDMEIEGMKTGTSDDYVDKREFRLLVGYLCVYVVMYDAFQRVDGGTRGKGDLGEEEDSRIELDEWLASYGNVSDHSLVGLKNVDDPKAIFGEMDTDNGGIVLLGEWCRYLANKEVEADTFLGSFLNISNVVRDETSKPTKSSATSTKDAKLSVTSAMSVTAEAATESSLKPDCRFTGEAMVTLGKGVSMDAHDFVDSFRAMGQKNDDSKKLRMVEWHHCDFNANGLISLAECDLWVKEVLISKCIKGEGERIWKRYRRCYIHAFNRAKNVSKEMEIEGMKTATSDDYVDKREFRIMVGYLCVYVVMYDAFQMVDGGKRGEGILGDDTEDLRIELDEWLASYGNVSDHSLVGLKNVDDPKAIFGEMDADNGGMVLLSEWCRYLTKKEVEAKTYIGSYLDIAPMTRSVTHDKHKGPTKDASPPPTVHTTTSETAAPKSALKPIHHFTGDRMVTLGKGVSMDAKDFVDCFRVLGQKNDKSKKLRMQAWHHCDYNGNGVISLAECDLWIKEMLKSKCIKGEGERIWKRYRRCYIHAFNRAKNVAEDTEIDGMETATTNDFVVKKEFRIMVGYLCVYVVMYDAFQMVDGGKRGEGILGDDTEDLRIELDEWLASYRNVSDHTLVGLKNVDDPKAIFGEMDVDGGGMVLLGEWCRYLAKKEVEAHTLLGSFLDISNVVREETHKPGVKKARASPSKKSESSDATSSTSSLKPNCRFTGKAMIKLGKGVSTDACDFIDSFRAMGQKNDDSKKLRMVEWKHCDYNGNGLISLAECDLWVKEVLISKCIKGEGERIWKRYRRCYIHAFNRAKNVSKEMEIEGMKTATSDDYVDKREFRIMVGYLCVYVLLYDAFQMVDGGKRGEGILGDDTEDLRIELDEWLASYGNVSDHSLVGLKNVDDPKAIFGEMDADNGGMVLLSEWCRYLAKKEVEAKTLMGQYLDIATTTRSATHNKSRSPTKSPGKTKSREAAPKSALKPIHHFTGDRMVTLGKGVSMDAKDFVDCFRVLGQKNDKSKKLRMQAWHHCDYNGNGVISLAECDLWIKEMLKSKCIKGEGERIWKRYRRCYIHAFNRAKNVAEDTEIDGMETATTNDFVVKKEFRIMVGYLCVYVVMYDAFQMVDGGKRGEGILGDDTEDLRIELDEWLASYRNVSDHTLVGLKNVDDPKAIFGEMDVDGGGMVLLGEWCRYLAKKEVEGKTVLGAFLDIANITGASTPSSPVQ